MNAKSIALLSLSVLALAACDDPYKPTMRPDYAIRVVQTPHGEVAVPPPCPSWSKDTLDPYDNQVFPQFGCATQRNLALQIERPEDLVQGRALGPERGVNAVGEVRRYDNNQTRGLLDPQSATDSVAAATTAAVPASAIVGDVTGAAASTSSSTNSSAAGP